METVAILEAYVGPKRLEEELSLRDRSGGETALKRLDGQKNTALYIERGGERTLTVAGGPDRFQISIWDSEADRGLEARDMAAAEGSVDLVIAGQSACLPLAETLGFEAALSAICAFLLDGSATPDVVWHVNE